MHTTNYYDTFIQIADDSPVGKGEIPPVKKEPTVASRQFEMISAHPYRFTSDDVLFSVYADKNDIPDRERARARETFFSKGQACLRSSPLGKRYGWGIHHDAAGKVALVAADSEKYHILASDKNLKQVKAMRSKKT